VDELAIRRQPVGISDETIAKLKAANPGAELVLLQAAGEEAVFRTPPYAEWKRFKSLYLDPAQRPMALETLVFGCLVHPAATDMREVLNRRPALAEVFGERLASAAGMGAEAVEKKL
jgi:hypothetical protein